jgi:hypothetical protein
MVFSVKELMEKAKHEDGFFLWKSLIGSPNKCSDKTAQQ